MISCTSVQLANSLQLEFHRASLNKYGSQYHYQGRRNNFLRGRTGIPTLGDIGLVDLLTCGLFCLVEPETIRHGKLSHPKRRVYYWARRHRTGHGQCDPSKVCTPEDHLQCPKYGSYCHPSLTRHIYRWVNMRHV